MSLPSLQEANNFGKSITEQARGSQKFIQINPCQYVRSLINGAIYPYSSMFKDKGEFFEPYYGDLNVKKDPFAIAFYRCWYNAETKDDKERLIRKLKDIALRRLDPREIVEEANRVPASRSSEELSTQMPDNESNPVIEELLSAMPKDLVNRKDLFLEDVDQFSVEEVAALLNEK